MEKIFPCLWFNDNAEEAVKFYTSIFKNSKILETSYYGKASSEVSGKKEGSVMSITFQLNNTDFMALNGGPEFSFTPAISFVIYCENQEEVDYYWNKLIEGGDEKSQQCGWLQDKFGVSWQVVPRVLDKMLMDKDKNKAEKVMKAMLDMKKIEIPKLEKAYKS